jgi:hypothetical protein
VPAQTPEQLLEVAQEHIRPLIRVIDQLNEADAEDELRVISRQLTRLCFRTAAPALSSLKSRSARRKLALASPARLTRDAKRKPRACRGFRIKEKRLKGMSLSRRSDTIPKHKSGKARIGTPRAR